VRFRPEGRDQEVAGELVWKSTSVDDTTRTVQFRAELPNADGSLLANTFGTGQIILREEKQSTVVPNEAVHWEGDCHIVFVRDKDFLDEGAPKVFHVRSVRPGVKNGSHTEIIAGILPGEVVATRNSATLRAQLLKNNLGAG
jgi:cobalt-zinc-cadmium efflux system membrane fusion protein